MMNAFGGLVGVACPRDFFTIISWGSMSGGNGSLIIGVDSECLMTWFGCIGSLLSMKIKGRGEVVVGEVS